MTNNLVASSSSRYQTLCPVQSQRAGQSRLRNPCARDDATLVAQPSGGYDWERRLSNWAIRRPQRLQRLRRPFVAHSPSFAVESRLLLGGPL